MTKKKAGFKLPFDSKWLWGALATVIIIPSLTFGRDYIGKVFAAPQEIEQLKVDQAELRKQSIQQGDWIAQSIKETDMKKKAPKGFRYEESLGEYIEWKQDPRLRKK